LTNTANMPSTCFLVVRVIAVAPFVSLHRLMCLYGTDGPELAAEASIPRCWA
jgi:hypothetical protein